MKTCSKDLPCRISYFCHCLLCSSCWYRPRRSHNVQRVWRQFCWSRHKIPLIVNGWDQLFSRKYHCKLAISNRLDFIDKSNRPCTLIAIHSRKLNQLSFKLYETILHCTFPLDLADFFDFFCDAYPHLLRDLQTTSLNTLARWLYFLLLYFLNSNARVCLNY